MVAPYTAVDLIRVMEHEMTHHHQEAARRRALFRRGGHGETRSDATPATGRKRSRRRDGASLLSLFSRPVA